MTLTLNGLNEIHNVPQKMEYFQRNLLSRFEDIFESAALQPKVMKIPQYSFEKKFKEILLSAETLSIKCKWNIFVIKMCALSLFELERFNKIYNEIDYFVFKLHPNAINLL